MSRTAKPALAIAAILLLVSTTLVESLGFATLWIILPAIVLALWGMFWMEDAHGQ